MDYSNQETEQLYAEVVETVDNDFSPLDAPVKQRSYTQHKFDNGGQPVEDLAEPNFEAPTFTDFDNVEEQAQEPDRVFNESYSELDGKEKTMGAEMMAEMTLDLYSTGCSFLGKVPQISESKLDQMISDGEINPDITLQTESGNLPIKEFAAEYNESIKEAFIVTDEFKEKVKPPLIRVFKKRGIGMTDEQLLMYYFGQDIAVKGIQAFTLKKTANSILDSLRENTAAIIASQAPKPSPAPAPAPASAQNTQTVSNDSDYTENVAEFVSNTKPQAKEKPKTVIEEQLQYFEPEEGGDSIYNNLKGEGGFKDEYVAPDGMPTFGDVEILSQLEKLSGQPTKPVRRTKAVAKKPVGRKPRAK
jgi:hypothetical protein